MYLLHLLQLSSEDKALMSEGFWDGHCGTLRRGTSQECSPEFKFLRSAPHGHPRVSISREPLLSMHFLEARLFDHSPSGHLL